MALRDSVFSVGLVACLVSTPLIGMAAAAAVKATLPDGPGVELVSKTCVGCHGPSKLTREWHTPSEWTDIVEDMVLEGAKMTDEERVVILTYLNTHLGKPEAQSQGLVAETPSSANKMTLAKDAKDPGVLKCSPKGEHETVCLAGRNFRDMPEGPEMVIVPGGTFQMGSTANEPAAAAREHPRHEVIIAAFAVGRFEVSLDEWNACVEAQVCKSYPWVERQGTGRMPATELAWSDAQDYVGWLSKSTGKRYRLLSEAEWEYAARARTTTPYYYGSAIGLKQANFAGEALKPVGSYPANNFGLHDMFGNAWEWTQDCWHETYEKAPGDGRAWEDGDLCRFRALRGGGWYNVSMALRSAMRFAGPAGNRNNGIGFRVARTLD